MTIKRFLSTVLTFTATAAMGVSAAKAAPFEFIRIGDADGFGFTNPNSFQDSQGGNPDRNQNGVIEQTEFLPNLAGNSGVNGQDQFDNRNSAELTDARFQGIGFSDNKSSGSNLTDRNLDPEETNINPRMIFDFFVDSDDIVAGADVFFNLVFGDYDVRPASLRLRRANGSQRTVNLTLQGGNQDGLVQAATTTLGFNEVFTAEGGGYRGFLDVLFQASQEPHIAIDYTELSVEEIALDPPDPLLGAPGALDFGAVLVNDTGKASLTVSNDGEAGSQLSGDVTTTGRLGITPPGSGSFNLSDEETAEITLTYQPDAKDEAQDGTVDITSNGGRSDFTPTAKAVAPVAAPLATAGDAPIVRQGTGATISKSYSNTGNGNEAAVDPDNGNTLTASGVETNLTAGVNDISGSGAAAYSIVNGTLSLKDGAAGSFTFALSETAAIGAQTAAATITFDNGKSDGSNDPFNATAALDAVVVGPNAETDRLPGGVIDFGAIKADETVEQSVTLSNDLAGFAGFDLTGYEVFETGLTLLDAQITGKDAALFNTDFAGPVVLHDSSGFDLASVLDVTFAPSLMAGDFTATLTLFTDQGQAFVGAAGGGMNDYDDGFSFAFTLQGTAEPVSAPATGLLALLGLSWLYRAGRGGHLMR